MLPMILFVTVIKMKSSDQCNLIVAVKRSRHSRSSNRARLNQIKMSVLFYEYYYYKLAIASKLLIKVPVRNRTTGSIGVTPP